MREIRAPKASVILFTVFALALALPIASWAQDPEFTTDFNRENCNFSTTGNNKYLPIWPGLALRLEGEEEDDGELIEISVVTTILQDTVRVDGVLTRVLEEVESEDGELVEISRNFVAVCRETGDVWYFGEDVDDYEDGEIVGHEGAWRAGQNGAIPGILMPGSPQLGARFSQEIAPGVAEDRGEVVAMGEEITVPAGTYTDTLTVVDTDALDPGPGDPKVYAAGLGNIKDEELELVEVTLPACQPDDETHCLEDGRFRVEAEWSDTPTGNSGDAKAILSSGLSGEFWFFNSENTELIVKVLDACDNFGSFWVFAGGLTSVVVELTVTDTRTGQVNTYVNMEGNFAPLLDTSAFQSCDAP